MSRVFLSHVRTDRAQARRLAEALRQAGYTPWLAEDEARVGESVAETLSRGLRDTQAAVVLLSRTSVESAWTSTEVALLRTHAREQLRLHIVRLDRVTPPAELAAERVIDLFPGETAWQSGVKQLCHVLGSGTSATSGTEASELPPNNLPPRAAHFVGREPEIATLHERLMMDAHIGRAVVYGPRGIGKTALAVEYATRYAADYPGGIWWLPARLGPKRALSWMSWHLCCYRDTSITSIWKLVEQIPFRASAEEIAQRVSQALQSTSDRTLIILDDARGGDWQDYLHSDHIHVLATSRITSPPYVSRASAQRLLPMSRMDATSLMMAGLRAEGTPLQKSATDRIFDEWLRGKPLLITMVSRLVARSQTSWDVLDQDLTRRVQRARSEHPASARTASEAAVLDLCIERFPANSLGRQLLEGASCFAHALPLDVPLAWGAITGHSPVFEEAPEEMFEALQDLEDSGLVYGQTPFCQLHEAVAQRAKALATPETWARVTDQGLAASLEWIQEQEHYDAYEPWSTEGAIIHLEAVLHSAKPRAGSRVWLDAENFLAARFSRRGEHFAEIGLRKRALRHAQEQMHGDVELINSLRSKLALAHITIDNTSAALRLLEQAVADDALTPRGDVAIKSQRLAELALLRFNLDEPVSALESIDRALKLDREVLAENDPKFPLRLYLRGRILRRLQRYDEAHVVLEKALDAGEQFLAGDPLALVPIMEALAESRRENYDEKGALTLLERAIEEDRRQLGDEHYETVFHITQLARTYAEFERRAQTRSTVDRVLALLDKALPPTDTRRAELLLRLAESLKKVGEHEDAHRLLAHALDVEAAQPEPDSRRLSALVMTALLRSDQSNDIPLLERALSLTQRGAGKPPTALETLAKFLVHVLDTTAPAAVPITHAPIQTSSPGAGAESLERALRLARRSQVRDEMKAEALQEALTAAQQGDDLPNGARACLLLADLEGRRGAWEQARAHARKGLQLALRADLPAIVAEGYRVLGDTALHGSFYEEARMSYEEAIRRYDSLGDPGSAARTRMLLVTLLMQLGHLEGLEDHVRWLDEHQQHPSLTEEDREDVRKVLALAGARLSSPTTGARHPRS